MPIKKPSPSRSGRGTNPPGGGYGRGGKKRNPTKEFEVKFTIRRSPAHIGVRMGEHNLVRWLDSFIFFNTMNTELDKLHRKWLNQPMEAMPTL